MPLAVLRLKSYLEFMYPQFENFHYFEFIIKYNLQ